MKTLIPFLAVLCLFSSCHNQESKSVRTELEQIQQTQIEAYKRLVEERRSRIFIAYQIEPEKIEKYLNKTERIVQKTNKLLNKLDTQLQDSVGNINLEQVYQDYLQLVQQLKQIALYQRSDTLPTLDQNLISFATANHRNILLMIYQDILNQEYYYLGAVMQNIGYSEPSWRTTIPSTYFQHRDSSYIDLHFPRSDDFNFYTMVDTIIKDRKITQTDYFPETMNIVSRIKLYKLDTGNYTVKGKLRVVRFNGELHDFPFDTQFEIN